jgi:protein phosphatase-4 regulatory subunit 3
MLQTQLHNKKMPFELILRGSWTKVLFLHLRMVQMCDSSMLALLCNVAQVITRILQHSASNIKLRATDVLLSALAHDPMPLRQFLASQPRHELLDIMVQQFISSGESGLPEQIAELLKLLADPGRYPCACWDGLWRRGQFSW